MFSKLFTLLICNQINKTYFGVCYFITNPFWSKYGLQSIVISCKLVDMTSSLKQNNLSIKTNIYADKVRRPIKERPNIDHLIKRILSERREQEKKNIFTITFILLIIGATTLFSIYN